MRRALAGTHELSPRPVADLELSPMMQKVFSPALPHLKPAAVLLPLVKRPHELTVLLTKRSEQLRNHKGQISFPGGRRDATDASFAACALREAWEEVALPPDNVEILGYLDDYPTGTGYRVTPVVGLVTPPERYQLDAGEVAEVFEVPLALFLEAERFERKSLIRGGVDLPYFEVNYGHYRIWGVTAGVLWNFCKAVSQAR